MNRATQLFTPVRMGGLELRNRIAMAPMTHMSAHPDTCVPTELQIEYYAQRASAGLIVAESTAISPQGFGWAGTPGLWSRGQICGWRKVTDAVHAAGGRIVAQLWHAGAMSHPDPHHGVQPVSVSGVSPEHESVTATGRKPSVAPRSMTAEEIEQTARDYAHTARNAIDAGFDGVQILAGSRYLIAQFLNRATNRRCDRYGGGIENRARFLFEIVEAILEEIDASRVGVGIGPMHETGSFAANDETLPITEYAVRELDGYGLSHLLLMGNSTDIAGSPIGHLSGDAMFAHFRPIFRGTLIADVGMDPERAERLVRDGLADMAVFGRPCIANPDLVERLETGAPLAPVDWSTVYATGPQGYTDHPSFSRSLQS